MMCQPSWLLVPFPNMALGSLYSFFLISHFHFHFILIWIHVFCICIFLMIVPVILGLSTTGSGTFLLIPLLEPCMGWTTAKMLFAKYQHDYTDERLWKCTQISLKTWFIEIKFFRVGGLRKIGSEHPKQQVFFLSPSISDWIINCFFVGAFL